jgi:hypothetical protein
VLPSLVDACVDRGEPLPIGSWRAHGQLVELRAAELSLGGAEAAALRPPSTPDASRPSPGYEPPGPATSRT